MDAASLLFRVETLLFLLLIATVSAIVLKKINIPFTIGLVPVGIAIAALLKLLPVQHVESLGLGRELIMYVLLPALIFDASINIDTKLLKRHLYPTLMLAGPGLAIATFITGGIVHWVAGVSWGSSMIFGALISATDPVAVISLFEIVGAPRRLRILVDGESLFNDATAIAMFNVVTKLVFGGIALSWGEAALGAGEFCWAFLGGLGIGVVFGFVLSFLMNLAGEDPHIKIGISIVLAYTAFIVADRVGVSGVMAAMGAGMVVSRVGVTKFSDEVRAYMHDFWAFMSFLANSAIFLLLGFTEADNLFDLGGGGRLLLAVGAAILAIQAARVVVVYGMSPFIGFGKNRIGLDYQTVMFWGGLRGAVPLALVFSIPQTYIDRTLIMQITLAVVLFTLLVQGLTTERLLKLFGLDQPGTLSKLSEWYTMLKARRAAVDALGIAASEKNFDETAIARLTGEYNAKLDAVVKSVDFKDPANWEALDRMIWAGVVEVERVVIGRYLRSGLLLEAGCRRLLAFNSAMADDLDAERVPDSAVDAKRIAALFKSFGWRPLEKSWFRRLFPPRTFELFCRDFAMLMTLIIATRAIRAELSESAERFPGGLADGALNPCFDFLTRRSAELRRRLAELRGFDSQLYMKAQEYVLRCVIFDAELKVVETANASGALDATEFEKLSDTISSGKTAALGELRG